MYFFTSRFYHLFFIISVFLLPVTNSFFRSCFLPSSLLFSQFFFISTFFVVLLITLSSLFLNIRSYFPCSSIFFFLATSSCYSLISCSLCCFTSLLSSHTCPHYLFVCLTFPQYILITQVYNHPLTCHLAYYLVLSLPFVYHYPLTFILSLIAFYYLFSSLFLSYIFSISSYLFFITCCL